MNRSYRSSYLYGYRHKCIDGCLLTANKLFVVVVVVVFSIHFYWLP